MTDWVQTMDPSSLLIGLMTGLLVAAVAAMFAWRAGSRGARESAEMKAAELQEELVASAEALHEAQVSVSTVGEALHEAKRESAVLEARMASQTESWEREKQSLEASEKRLGEQFERLAGKVFEDRTKKFSELSEKQLETLLKPLSKDLESFRGKVEETHKEEIAQHRALRERLNHLEHLNQRLNDEAHNLTRALTTQVKAQGSWGEQQLEKLLELSGLGKGEHYHTQVSVTGADGQRLQPDFVLRLPEGRSIVMDSKVSLTAWTRAQATDEEDESDRHLADHVKSLRAHIDGLSAKNYPGAEELNALDFVLMFVPIESALITALHRDPNLPEYALSKRVALLSPANFLATVRTVASVWMVHKQNTNARDIAERAGKLYDKFVGFTENLRGVGDRLRQAQVTFDSALSQLSSGSGNLVRQAEMLRELGAKHQKQLDEGLVERSGDQDLKRMTPDQTSEDGPAPAEHSANHGPEGEDSV